MVIISGYYPWFLVFFFFHSLFCRPRSTHTYISALIIIIIVGSRQSEQTVEHSQNARRHQTRQKRDASKAWHGRAGQARNRKSQASIKLLPEQQQKQQNKVFAISTIHSVNTKYKPILSLCPSRVQAKPVLKIKQ